MIEEINALLDKDLYNSHRDIVESFRKNLLKWGHLTDRQVDYFHAIASNYSDEALQQKADFGRKLKEDEAFRERLRVVCEYYQRTGYFRSVVSASLGYLNNPNGYSPPSYQDVTKMMENKYAQNILDSHFGEEKFAVGEMVQIRASLSRDNLKGDSGLMPRKWAWASKQLLKDSTFLVVEVNSHPITRSLTYDEKKGGTRWYKLLPLGETDPIHVIEKGLKRPTAKLLRGE